MWICPTEGTYIVIEKSGIVVICPSEDIEPHNLDGLQCACETETHPQGNRLTILHTRFSERTQVAEAVSALFS